MQELQTLLTDVQTALAPLLLRQPEETFNIFRLLRSESDEVNLHSRFLADLLNPKGSHGMGDVFLRLFLEQCGVAPEEFHLDTAYTLRENAKIDILIQNNRQAIIIENKIWAGDQDRQLERYAEIVAHRQLQYRIFYLTLMGGEPSEQSVGVLASRPDYKKVVRCISYQRDVHDWLSECIKEAATKPGLRETLVQYQQIVKKLTGNTMSEVEQMEVIQLMKLGNNAVNAQIIERNWKHVRWHTEFDFWKALAAVIEAEGYQISPEGRYSDVLLDAVIHHPRNRDSCYGIAIDIPSLSSSSVDVTFSFERGEEVLRYGFRVAGAEDSDEANEVYNAIENKTKQLHYGKTPEWPVLKNPTREINFYLFNNKDTVSLANPDVREVAVKQLWAEAKELMQEVETMMLG